MAQPTKQSYLFAFDRVSGTPIWPIEERPVPAGDTDLWHFGDGAPILMVAGRLEQAPEIASGRSWNYTGLTAFADLDALVQLYGHIREKNPGRKR